MDNTLIQKTMNRDRFWEILQNLHFVHNLQKLPPKESESFDCAWELRPFFDDLLKHFQEALLPESHQSINEHRCKFKGKSLMCQYMKNKLINGASHFGFSLTPSLFVSIRHVFGKKVQNRIWVWWISCSLPLRESKKQLLLPVIWQLFYKFKSHAKAIWGWNLCNWNCEIKLEAHAHFERQ